MFENRRKQLNQIMRENGMQAVLISSPSNLYYFTGFTGGEAFFVMLTGNQQEECIAISKGDEKETVSEWKKTVVEKEMNSEKSKGYVITDSRYYEQVEKECQELTLIRLEQKGYSETVREFFEKFDGDVKVAVEDDMNLSMYLKLCQTCNNCEFQLKGEAINACRMVKDEEEIEKIRQAETIGDAAFSHILTMIKPGITEAEIALELEFFMKKQGASKLSFDTIVASGANSSMPHAQVTDRRVEMGDFVTMDFGCVYQGYCSDMTRTIAVGNPTDEMRKVYQIVYDANKRAMEQVAEGKRCSYIDSLARDYIKEQGYGEYFGHGLGHGVGLDIHEEPRFSPKCDTQITENMVITVEPGIYLPGKFGVRIEDLVVVKKDGFENLTHSPKELIIL